MANIDDDLPLVRAIVTGLSPEVRTEILKLVHSPKPGAPFKAARTGFPQHKVANWFKVSPMQVYRWENNIQPPPAGYSLALRLSGNWDEMETVLRNYWNLKSLKKGDAYNTGKIIHTDHPEYFLRRKKT